MAFARLRQFGDLDRLGLIAVWALLHTEVIEIHLTPRERMLLEGLAEMRGMTVSDLVRELIGLGRENEIRPQLPRLRQVSA